jgi:hypothetical protein
MQILNIMDGDAATIVCLLNVEPIEQINVVKPASPVMIRLTHYFSAVYHQALRVCHFSSSHSTVLISSREAWTTMVTTPISRLLSGYRGEAVTLHFHSSALMPGSIVPTISPVLSPQYIEHVDVAFQHPSFGMVEENWVGALYE